jgi:tryptophan-rich sensory protein
VPRGGGGGGEWSATAAAAAARRKPGTSSALFLKGDDSANSVSTTGRPPVDFEAIGKYAASLTVQMALIFGVLAGIDKLVARYSLTRIPFYANVLFFYLFNLNTSAFSLLPQLKEKATKQQDWEYQRRKRPSWTPPGYVFAIMWPLFVFGTRAVTAATVVSKTSRYADPAIMALMLHLCVANLWNTVNNVERRLGVSVIVLYALWITKAYAAVRFHRVDAVAGRLLASTLTWLTAAAALETNTWLINPDPDTGEPEPLYPARAEKWKTRFRWE